ncbi:membrane hypothetical protein [uncultured Gammaproteobacteria bacterium]
MRAMIVFVLAAMLALAPMAVSAPVAAQGMSREEIEAQRMPRPDYRLVAVGIGAMVGVVSYNVGIWLLEPVFPVLGRMAQFAGATVRVAGRAVASLFRGGPALSAASTSVASTVVRAAPAPVTAVMAGAAVRTAVQAGARAGAARVFGPPLALVAQSRVVTVVTATGGMLAAHYLYGIYRFFVRPVPVPAK